MWDIRYYKGDIVRSYEMLLATPVHLQQTHQVNGHSKVLTISVHKQHASNKTPSHHTTYVQVPCKIMVLRENETIFMK